MSTNFKNIEYFLDYYNRRSRFYNDEIRRYQKLIELYETRLKIFDHFLIHCTREIEGKKLIIQKLDDKINNIELLTCKICMENISQCIIRPCLHFCCCLDCMLKLVERKCPICRIPFNDFYKIFN